MTLILLLTSKNIPVRAHRAVLSPSILFTDKAPYAGLTPRASEWDELMRRFQQKVKEAGPNDWWMPLREVFDLGSQVAQLND